MHDADPVVGTALAAGQHPFTDVPQSHWANEAVGYVYENDLMNGVSATMFQPGGSLTRAMFVTILGRMAGAEEESGESGFADVPAGRWYSAYVAWAAGEGIVDGTGNGCFSPNSPVTREQMATMIARYVDSADLPLPETGDPAAPFTDRNAVSDWAEAGVELMRQTGILAGYEDGHLPAPAHRQPGGGRDDFYAVGANRQCEPPISGGSSHRSL